MFVTVILLTPLQLLAQGTAFTYQGRLNQNGAPYTGTAEFLASLWEGPSGGSALASNLTGSVVVGVSNGLFTLPLDFGANFTGADRWLELDVRTGLGAFTQLSPRQQLTPTPYAVYAGNVSASGISGSISDSQLSTNIARLNGSNLVFTGQVQFNNTNSAFRGTFTGNGTGITNVPLNALNSYGMINWGDFTAVAPLPAGSAPGFVITPDVNGDGRPDIACANGGGTLSIYTNNGSGGFVLSSSPTVGGGAAWLTSVDVNGDGKPDLITANYGTIGDGNTLSVLTNNGSGGFVLSTSPLVGHGPLAIAAGDFNGDGRIDLATANATDGTISVLLQNSAGTFNSTLPLSTGGTPIGLITTNLTGTTNLDLICVLDSGLFQIYMGGGNGIFSFFSGGNLGSSPVFVTSADVNGDGVPELVAADSLGGNLVVYNFSGNTKTNLAVPGQPNAVTISDINGDGHPDLLTANADGTVSIFLNDGSGHFTLSSSVVAGVNPLSVAAADLNGDGKIDLVTANFDGNNLSLLLNAPHFTGGFTGDGSGLTSLNASNFASGTLSDARLSGNIARLDGNQVFSSAVQFSNPGSSFSGSGAGLTNVWHVGGDTGANPTNGAFLGTVDKLPLEFKVNGQRALRLQPAFYTAPSVIGGAAYNFVAPGVSGGTVGGGGAVDYSGAHYTNSVLQDFGTVAGGDNNTAAGFTSTIGGGGFNTATGLCAVVAGGQVNNASGQNATIAGGVQNAANGFGAAVGGGQLNRADGDYSTIPGGEGNWAIGSYSLAAGRLAISQHQGSFVWADSQNSSFGSSTSNTFNIRAQNGVHLDNSTSLSFGSQIRQMINLWNTTYGIGVQSFTEYFRTDVGGGFSWYSGGVHNDGQNNPGGGSELMRLTGNGLNVTTPTNTFNGKVGIGLGTPAQLLHLYVAPGNREGMEIDSPIAGDAPAIYLNHTGANGRNFRIASYGDNLSSGSLRIRDETAGVYRITMDASGNVGIGTTIPDNALTVNGSADKPGGGSWGTFSDARLKDVGENFTNGIEALENIRPIHYHYKSDNALSLPAQPEYIGVVAQEVERSVPEAVEHSKTGYLVVNNDPIFWTTVNAVKSLNRKIEAADRQSDSRIQKLEAENTELKARLEKLERLIDANHADGPAAVGVSPR